MKNLTEGAHKHLLTSIAFSPVTTFKGNVKQMQQMDILYLLLNYMVIYPESCINVDPKWILYGTPSF